MGEASGVGQGLRVLKELDQNRTMLQQESKPKTVKVGSWKRKANPVGRIVRSSSRGGVE